GGTPERHLEPVPLRGRWGLDGQGTAVAHGHLEAVRMQEHPRDAAPRHRPVERRRTVPGVAADGVPGLLAVHANLMFAAGNQLRLNQCRAAAVALGDGEARLRTLPGRRHDGPAFRAAQGSGADGQVAGPMAVDEREVMPFDVALTVAEHALQV